jgi:outer membrane protein TolC
MQQPLMTLALLGWVSTLQAGLAWDALPQAVQGAPAAQALGAEAQAASARQAGAARAFAPRLQVFGAARGEGYDPAAIQESGAWPEAGLRASANLWRGGRDAARSRLRSVEAEQSAATAKADTHALLLRSRLAWLEGWQARARVAAHQAALSRTAQDLQRVRRQAQAGLVPRSDVLALEVLAAELDQHVFDEGHLADEAEHHVAALLGLPDAEAEGLCAGQALDWPAAPTPLQPHSAQQEALSAGLRALDAQAQALGGAWQPALDLEAQAREGRVGYSLGGARDWQAQAVLSLAWDPAAATDKDQAWLQGQSKAQALRLKAQAAADAVKLAELDHALASWLGRKDAVQARLETAAKFRQAVLDEAARGVRDSRDLAESNASLLEADLDFIVARVRAWTVWSERQAFEAAKP